MRVGIFFLLAVLLTPSVPCRAEQESTLNEMILLGVLRSSLPSFVEICTARLARAMEAAGEQELEKNFSEEELQRWAVSQLERRSAGMLSEVGVMIHDKSFIGSGWVGLGPRKVRMMAQVGVEMVEGTPRLSLRRVRMNGSDVPEELLRRVELEVNRAVGNRRIALRIRDLDLHEGSAWIRAETK